MKIKFLDIVTIINYTFEHKYNIIWLQNTIHDQLE